jgi:LPS-assembly protein
MSLIRQPILLADCSESIGTVQHHTIATMRFRLQGAREVRLRLRGARVSLDFLFFTLTKRLRRFSLMPDAKITLTPCMPRCLFVFFFILLAHPAFSYAQEDAKPQPQNPATKQTSRASSASPQAGANADQSATLEADQQRQVGRIYYADGNVDVHYQNTRLRADHVEYNEDTYVAIARGHVQLDYMTQHIEADEAHYEVRTGHGTFHHVRATFSIERHPTPTLLVTPNPLYFEAEEAERLDEHTYRIKKAWMTVCDPDKPTWKFYAPEATVYLQKSVHLVNGDFRVFSVPVLYLPYATFPAGKERESGFMIPNIGDSSNKGYILGESYYWAPTDWMDGTLGGNYYSRRGWSQRADLRMRPWENAKLEATYTGVIDRGLEQPQVPGEPPVPAINQGGHEARLLFTALLPDGWRAVADLDNLNSLTYRLAWSETYTQAVNSEVRNSAFLTNNFRGFSLNFASLSYQNYLSATPDTYVSLRAAPEVRFGSVDQSPFPQLPIYFSFGSFIDAVHRSDTVTPTPLDTPNFVGRSELAPSVTIPLHLGNWLDLTPTFTVRSTYYGGQADGNTFVDRGFFRTTEELSVDLRPPSFDRVWEKSGTKWKHVIEPDIVYNYVSGVNDYARYIRFDEDETLTDTNEIEYGITQRLYRRKKDGDAEELVRWRLVQKYFFDPTFGGALINGQRNVFQTLDEVTPFAFTDSPRRFSPIVSDLVIEPGKHFDTEFIVNFDPKRNQLTAIGTLLKLKPYKQSFLTLAHFSTTNLPTPPDENPPNFVFESRSNQVRALVGYGDLTRIGFNATAGLSYDFTQQAFQNQILEASYNGSCCGFGFEYRRFSFGTIRNENQYLVVFRIANVGSAGTLRKAEKIF